LGGVGKRHLEKKFPNAQTESVRVKSLKRQRGQTEAVGMKSIFHTRGEDEPSGRKRS